MKRGASNGRGQNVSVITVLLVVSHFSGVPNIAGHVRNPYLMNWMDLYESFGTGSYFSYSSMYLQFTLPTSGLLIVLNNTSSTLSKLPRPKGGALKPKLIFYSCKNNIL